MVEQPDNRSALSPAMLESLLRTVRRRQQSGDSVAARALLHALAAQQPDDPRIWLALVAVAETRAEQRRALEHVLTLDPQNRLARRGLARLAAVADRPRTAAQAVEAPAFPAETAAITPAPALTPLPADRARNIRWPLYAAIGLAVALVLVVATALRVTSPPAPGAPTPTPAGALVVLPRVTRAIPASPAPATAAAAAPAPRATNRPAPTVTAAPPTTVPTPQPPPSPTPPPPPSPTPPPALAPGDVIVRRPWHISMLRPEYGVVLDGAIGTLQPHGRFALALVAVGNDSTAPARIPPNLFTLEDGSGHRYRPVPSASTTYLNTYGRGLRGDLSLEEEIPPGGGNVSVPLIFDVLADARDLRLYVVGESLGWAVGGAASAPSPSPAP